MIWWDGAGAEETGVGVVRVSGHQNRPGSILDLMGFDMHQIKLGRLVYWKLWFKQPIEELELI